MDGAPERPLSLRLERLSLNPQNPGHRDISCGTPGVGDPSTVAMYLTGNDAIVYVYVHGMEDQMQRMSERRRTMHGGHQDDPAQRLGNLERGTTAADALAFFDSLPAVALDELTGSWRGGGVPTGNPLDGMLERYGWYGKRFDSVDGAHPLVVGDDPGHLLSVNPALIPIGLMVGVPRLVNTPVAARIFRLLRPLLRTCKPAARLRMTEYRGVLTATMIYDAVPINDAFRKVDDDTLLGVMDLRGLEEPFVFTLRRDRITPAS